MAKSYFLLKSEPNVWSIDKQKKAGVKGTDWDGVRNYQAANNLKKMKKGDLCFFYHSNIGKEIVGIVEVIKTAFIDPTDKAKKFVAVKVKFKAKLQSSVTLEKIKKNKNLKELPLIKQSRLSVMPIDTKSWKIILKRNGFFKFFYKPNLDSNKSFFFVCFIEKCCFYYFYDSYNFFPNIGMIKKTIITFFHFF